MLRNVTRTPVRTLSTTSTEIVSLTYAVSHVRLLVTVRFVLLSARPALGRKVISVFLVKKETRFLPIPSQPMSASTCSVNQGNTFMFPQVRMVVLLLLFA